MTGTGQGENKIIIITLGSPTPKFLVAVEGYHEKSRVVACVISAVSVICFKLTEKSPDNLFPPDLLEAAANHFSNNTLPEWEDWRQQKLSRLLGPAMFF